MPVDKFYQPVTQDRATREQRGADGRPIFEALEPRLLLSTILVTSTIDSGLGSLRDAILQSNALIGTDSIHFNIPGPGVHTISPLTELPSLTDSAIIDGYTQPGSSVNTLANGSNAVLNIELDGTNLILFEDGLRVNAGNSTVRGLVINRFSDGISLNNIGGNVIEGNFIGTDPTGTLALPNTDDGIGIGALSNNRIGGVTPASRNVISGNLSDGIVIGDGTFNLIEGNFIGTNASGMAALQNGGNGIRLARASNNTVGGTTLGARNIISGNFSDGVDIRAANNNIIGNYIGLNVLGNAAIPNLSNGVLVLGTILEPSPSNTIGGALPGERNIISGNTFHGVKIEGAQAVGTIVQGNYIGTAPLGTTAIANGRDGVRIIDALNTIVGGAAPGEGNLLSGNGSDGAEINGSNSIVIGNLVGTTVDGLGRLANRNNGIAIRPGDFDPATGNIIGGVNPGERNILSGNTSDGVEIELTTGNTVIGNFIGTDITGTVAIANNGDGVKLTEAFGNTIGGGLPGQRNILSGNLSDGVGILGDNNSVFGNFIGTDVTGTLALGNGGNGVFIIDDVRPLRPPIGSTGNFIGGTGAGQGNVISASGTDGVEFRGALVTNNTVQNNLIGLNAAGTAALPNSANGVQITNSIGNTIGGAAANQGNVISGNLSDGVELNGALAVNNLVYGNLIGLDPTGLFFIPNNSDGVEIQGASNNTIGGINAGQANTIAGNGGDGVSIIDKIILLAPTEVPNGNTVRGNAIFSNFSQGIDLGATGPQASDPGDIDVGPNGLQNDPVIHTITIVLGLTVVQGHLISTASTTFDLDFYRTAFTDPTGHGEADAYLGSTQVTTDLTGNADFQIVLAGELAIDQLVTATATSTTTGDTSEFSNTFPVALIGDLNRDGFVGLIDMNIVLGNWNQPVTPGVWLAGDPTGDGFVGIGDLNQVLSNWNASTPPAVQTQASSNEQAQPLQSADSQALPSREDFTKEAVVNGEAIPVDVSSRNRRRQSGKSTKGTLHTIDNQLQDKDQSRRQAAAVWQAHNTHTRSAFLTQNTTYKPALGLWESESDE